VNKLLLLVGAGVVIAGAGAAVIISKNNDNSVKVTNTSTGQSQNIKTGDNALISVDACDVLTETVAKQVLGEGASKGDTSAGNASSDDVSVSNCTYTFKTVTSGSALAQAQSTTATGLLVRAAKTKAGAEGNKAVFGSSRPAGVQDVSGYGDKAYWNPTYGQLNILKGNNWYILSHYTGVNPAQGTLDQAKQLADALKNNLK